MQRFVIALLICLCFPPSVVVGLAWGIAYILDKGE